MNQIQYRLIFIGNVCTQWSFLEYQFALAIWGMLGVDDRLGKIITGGLDILPRATMAINICRHLNFDRDLEQVLVEARKTIQSDLQDRRNKVVHGVGFSSKNAEGGIVEIEMHRGKGSWRREILPESEIGSLGDEISQLAMKVHKELVRCEFCDPEHGIFVGSG